MSRVSGLAFATLYRYRWSPMLERGLQDVDGNRGEPIYMHQADCGSYCDYACNGNKGAEIAEDIAAIEEELHRERPA